MEENGESSVAVRRIQGLDRISNYNSSSGDAVTGSTAWIGKGLSCVCAQKRKVMSGYHLK
ncbi:hypothetical protein HPP92_014895 [Vanilla planifolia]|uniref:Uncharacterized protein n=1 Tax=Vanilla planifolia TaxID=51239 RepID=A0A835QK64_VANPL|nr:hypothetical protein HPP92_014895 [Vanilla planifolia]